jgi:hypothetical protein
MAKSTLRTKSVEENDMGNEIIENAAAQLEDKISTSGQQRTRQERRKTYVKPQESAIPLEVIKHFAKDDYELRWVRWCVQDVPDYRNLNRREQEGYEFVTVEELPANYVRTLRIRDTQTAKGLVTNGTDLCLMKVDKDLRQSRREHLAGKAQNELDAVDIHVLEKKGLRNVGSRSSVSFREPSFRD